METLKAANPVHADAMIGQEIRNTIHKVLHMETLQDDQKTWSVLRLTINEDPTGTIWMNIEVDGKTHRIVGETKSIFDELKRLTDKHT